MLEIEGRAQQFDDRNVQLDISFELRAGEYVPTIQGDQLISERGH